VWRRGRVEQAGCSTDAILAEQPSLKDFRKGIRYMEKDGEDTCGNRIYGPGTRANGIAVSAFVSRGGRGCSSPYLGKTNFWAAKILSRCDSVWRATGEGSRRPSKSAAMEKNVRSDGYDEVFHEQGQQASPCVMVGIVWSQRRPTKSKLIPARATGLKTSSSRPQSRDGFSYD